jgi:hypothetical protein
VMAANLLFSRQPGNANNDVVAIALFLSSVAVLVNARWDRITGATTGALLVAGLAAGLALGTKLTVVPPVLALTVGVIWISGAGTRLRAAGIWLGGLAVAGGYWYLRNLIASGNPFPWQSIGPIHHAEALQGRHPYSIAHYATDTSVWGRYFTPALHERLGDLWPLYLALAVVAVVLVLWRGGRVERMLGVVAVIAAIAYLLTPLGASGPEGTPVGFRLNIRYLAPGLTLALTLLAIPPPFATEDRQVWRLGDAARLWRLGALGLLTLLIVVSADVIGEIDTSRIPGTAILIVALIAVPLGLVLLNRRGMDPIPLAGIGAAAILALAIGGRFVQKDYLEQRYRSTAPDYPRTEQPSVELGQGLGAAYDWAQATHDSKIALSGTLGALFQYGLWGPDSSNSVTYIGQHGSHGSFREIPECPEFIGAINNGDFDYVVTTPTYHQDDPSLDKAPVQREWLKHGVNVKRIAGAGLVDVWQLTGPISPLACAPGGTPSGEVPSATGV